MIDGNEVLMSAVLMILSGLFVRLVLPILATAVVVLALRRLARHSPQDGANGDMPCWQLHRLSNGYLQRECLDCDVFISAPVVVEKPHMNNQIN
jgi:hypothetical protein